jgi:dTDP-4-dehydrorhamnose reductase
MKILLIGKYGQLGWELQRSLAPLGELTIVDYPEIDLADTEATRLLVRAKKPDLIINSAAYTAVDNAESEPQICRAINSIAPGILGEEACATHAALIHYSTDYVFDGSKTTPYVETDQPNPLNTYGVSKLEGDLAVQRAGCASIILRTSWVYSTRNRGFVSKVLQWSRQQNTMRVVVDQIASPTWCRMLADATAQMVAMGVKDIFSFIEEYHGLYHVAGAGSATRWEWARAILDLDPQREQQITARLEQALSSEYPTPACRPLNSALDCTRFERTFGLKLPDWQTSLKLAMEKLPE